MVRRGRKQQTAKRSRLRSQKAKEQVRQRMLGFARSEKEQERIFNTNNTTHTVPELVNSNIDNKNINNNNNNNNNDIFTVEPLNNIRWSTEPNEINVLGYQRKGKQRPNKILTAKQKREQQFAETRKQREQQRGKERVFKEQEQVWPSNSTEKILLNAEAEEEARQKQAFENEIKAIMNGQYINNDYGKYNFNNLEKEHEEKEMRKATEKMNKMPKNRFYIRIDNGKIMNSLQFILYFHKTTKRRLGNKLEFLYLSENPNKSYYEIFIYNPERNSLENNWLFELYNSDFEAEEGYKIYRQNPHVFFISKEFSNTYDWFTDMNFKMYDAHLTRFIPIWNIRRYIPNMRYLYEEFQKFAAAKVSGRTKVKELKLKGLEKWINQMEKKTKKSMPRDAENIIQQMMYPVDYRYYQGRENLQRIKTNLFEKEPNNGKENLRKINTNLFQNE